MNRLFLSIFIIFVSLLIQSCAPKQIKFIARNPQAPVVKYCNDAIGHKAGAIPFTFGGTCCCTPTESHFNRCMEEGTIPKGLDYPKFLASYTALGIKTNLDHKGCNNRCQWGPHVVFGGKCMATPTPGTLNYERVISGDINLTIGECNETFFAN